MKLFKYDEFITESHLQLLLEANVDFSKDFISVLKKVDSPIAKNLIDIEGKEVDINQNYIDINKEKTDTLFFKPDDKVGKTAKVISQNGIYPQITYQLSKIEGSGVDKYEESDFISPENDTVGQVVKIYTLQEISSLLPEYKSNFEYSFITGNPLVIFQWLKNGKKHQILINKAAVNDGPSAVRSSEVSIGRFVRALLTKSGIKFKDAEIEDFVYKYRAEVEKLKDVLNRRFRVVKGDDIKKYYHRSKYESEGGDLGNSCMRYDRCQMYLDIYTQNSQASLLLLMSETDEDKICGRAILWEMEPYEVSTKVMDRIYTIRTADQQLFKDWAKENGYWFKERQDFSEYTDFVFRDKETGDIIEKRQGEFSVKLDNGGEYPSYPYMDSFKYYNPSTGTLYNSSNFDYKYELTDTEGGNGSCSECGGSGRVDCDDCDGDGEVGCNECDADGVIRCDECRGSGEEECSWCDGYGEKDCSNCDGSGEEDCEYCGGDGEDENGEQCSECSGSGKQTCHSCDGNGKRECNECDGDGTVKCGECDGDGEVECGYCDGSGNRECSTCDGNGRHDCPECS
jgi:hypothetical protein